MIDMKSTKQSRNFKSRAVSIMVCAVFVLCVLLSIGTVFFAKNVFAADGDDGNPIQTVNGVRFVQVAAGEDFAIGLTFDNKLYGWSLNPDNPGFTPSASQPSPSEDLDYTLGDYYSSIPTEINVIFRQGPGKENDKVDNTPNGYQWADTEYHNTTTDRIKKIVATRTTAAFLTDNGYIYTWGKDATGRYDKSKENVDMMDMDNSAHYLLNRNINGTGENKVYWYEPYIIDYNYYKISESSGGTRSDSMMYAKPTGNNSFGNTDIAAGEYNYVFTYSKTSGTYLYVWGSLMYNTVHTMTKTAYNFRYGTSNNYALTGFAADRNIIRISNSQLSGLSAVAGGYNVGYNGTEYVSEGTINKTSLMLRGRNFLTSQYDASNGYIKTFDTDAGSSSKIVYEQSSKNYDIEGGMIGGVAGKDDVTNPNQVLDINTETYYGRLNSESGKQTFAGNTGVYISNAHGEVLKDISDTVTYRQAYRNGVSLGNDVGYGIVGGTLYAWGDNFKGQLTGAVTDKFKQKPTGILSGKTVVSVAAGKQLSAKDKAMHYQSSLNITENTDEEDGSVTYTVNGFADSVKNEVDFISGALTASGELWVWSNNATDPEQITFGNADADKVNATDRFTAVYSGYGNNLFAVTETGKLIRVEYVKGEGDNPGAYKQTRYDEFRAIGGTKIDNWTVNSENTVLFMPAVAPTVDKVDPDLGSATFYVWNPTIVSHDGAEDPTGYALLNPISNEGVIGSGAYKTLVSSNAIGDVYRILGLTAEDHKVADNQKSGKFLSMPNDAKDDFAPVFKYIDGTTETVMTQKQCKNMFKFEIVTDENGVGLKITPKKSSKGFTIAIDFYIARYNSVNNFTLSEDKTSVTDTALYYDYKPCRITFKINDTQSVRMFSPFDGENGSGNSKIPLLDPNNDYNKFYSIAVQNVSGGVDSLIDFLAEYKNTLNDSAKASVKTAAIGKMSEADKGFPAKAKIDDGDLTYYLGNDVDKKYYTDVYKFLFTDRDADRIVAAPPASGVMTGFGGIGAGAVNGKVEEISVNNIDTGLIVNADLILDDLRKDFVREFDNVFGLYNIKLDVGTGNHVMLSFKYQVLQFEAVSATGNIEYDGENPSVSSFKTLATGTHVNASIVANSYAPNYALDENGMAVYGATGTHAEIFNTTDVASVFSMPSLRIYYTVPDPKDPNKQITREFSGNGKDGKNVLVQEYNEPLFVGEKRTLKLSDYFKATSGTIAFSYNNSVTQFDKFNALFVDQTGNDIQTVTLNGSELTIHPTIANQMNITVAVQRFAGAGNTVPFASGNEVVYATFIFTNILDFQFNTPTSNNPATGGQIITKSETFDILGASGSYNAGKSFVTVTGEQMTTDIEDNLKSMIKISNVTTSEDKKDSNKKLFTVSNTDKTITVTPQISGSGTVQFVATLFNKSLMFSLRIEVVAVTTVSETVTIVDDQYIYEEIIKGNLVKANSYNGTPYIKVDDYRILYNDFTNPEEENRLNKISNAVYFTDESGTVCSTPTFIRNVVFEGLTQGDKPYLRIISNNSPTDTDKTFYMHVKFINATGVEAYADAPAGSIIEAIYPVRSGKARINVSVDINCRDINSSTAGDMTLTINGEGTNATVSFTVTQLLNLIGTQRPGDYEVVIIRADETTSRYFTYYTSGDNKTIFISPNYNTPKDENGQPIPCELEVSLSNQSNPLVVTFDVTVDGILTTLPVMQGDDGIIGYGNIWLYSFIIVFGVLAIIFVVRFILYWRKRAAQRAIIKRNQELIRMRDRMHNKGATATREQVVKTKLKMDDPKYAKMFNEMRKSKEEESGVILEHSDLASIADKKSKKKKKKKGGKKTVAELKAELEAKKAAFAAAQGQPVQPDPFVQDVPVDGGTFAATDGEFVTPDAGFDPINNYFGEAQSIDGSDIIFDASDMGDGM